MKFCTKCGAKLEADAQVCSSCGETLASAKPVMTNSGGDTKGINILSYFGPLWLVGLLCSHKNDPAVRFHVGQGIILFIFLVGLNIIMTVFNQVVVFNIFKEEIKIFGFGTGQYQVSGLGIAISWLLLLVVWAFQIVMMILGIRNALKEEQKPLPLIGNLAFYK